jgi:hypothetical protein
MTDTNKKTHWIQVAEALKCECGQRCGNWPLCLRNDALGRLAVAIAQDSAEVSDWPEDE